MKRAAFLAILALMVLVLGEAGAQLMFCARYGHWVFREQPPLFTLREFTSLTGDARVVTMRAAYGDAGAAGWDLSTDAWRFRKGTYGPTDPHCANVVFIGDSVPFGFGVGDRDSLPSKLFDRLHERGDTRCVVNAAIPSYSLRQAVARYQAEIHGFVRARDVFLQVYDPAAQIVLLGAAWHPDDNWSNARWKSRQAPRTLAPLSDWSAAAAIVERAVARMSGDVLPREAAALDADTLERFRVSIRHDLARLYGLVREDGVERLVLSAVAPPPSSRRTLGPVRSLAVKTLNEELAAFALAHPGVIYLDSTPALDRFPESEVFLDPCCHLTKKGNDVVAHQLIGVL